MEGVIPKSQPKPKMKGQLDFHKAMQDFKNMFPGMDAEVIETVLRSNDGLVDVTVDQLISMASADATDASGGASCLASGAVGREAAHRRWRPPLLSPLPDDFLRLDPAPVTTAAPSASGASGGDRLNSAGLQERLEENRRQLAALGEAPDPEVARYLEDERVALMLQNEEFMDELRRNREFMDALDVDTPQFAAAQRYDGYESLDETQRSPKDSSHVHKYPDDEVFKERLKHMGKASRKKFAQLARLFHFNRRGGARAMLGHGPVPSGDQLLLSEDPLTADDLEQDEPGPAAPFEDRHTVETYRGEGKSPGRHHHQMV